MLNPRRAFVQKQWEDLGVHGEAAWSGCEVDSLGVRGDGRGVCCDAVFVTVWYLLQCGICCDEVFAATR